VNQLTTNKQVQIEILSRVLDVRTNFETDYLNVFKASIEEKIADIKIASENFENIILDWAEQLKKSIEILKTENNKIKSIEKEQQKYIKNLQLRLDNLHIQIEKINEIKKIDLNELNTQITKDVANISTDSSDSKTKPIDFASLIVAKIFADIGKQ
jgi:hypothetical protein